MSFLASLPERVIPGVRIGFPEADEARTAAAFGRLAGEGKVIPVAVREESGEPALRRAVSMLAAGELDGVVAGAVSTTADVLRAGLQLLGLDDGIRTVSSSFYMVLPAAADRPERVLTFTDAGVVPEPTAEQLAEIADCACRARTSIVGDEPRVAFLSYATGDSAEGGSVQRMGEAVRLFRRRRPEVPADGPVQADAAIVPEVAQRKAPASSIGGDANVLVFPDLDAGNIAYKLVQRLADARALGPILQGLAAPLNDLSRGASVEDILDVAYITALLANEARGKIR